jgi:hypothetical protein
MWLLMVPGGESLVRQLSLQLQNEPEQQLGDETTVSQVNKAEKDKLEMQIQLLMMMEATISMIRQCGGWY